MLQLVVFSQLKKGERLSVRRRRTDKSPHSCKALYSGEKLQITIMVVCVNIIFFEFYNQLSIVFTKDGVLFL